MKLINRPRVYFNEAGEQEMESVLNEIRNAEAVITFYRTPKQVYKVLHTGLTENDYSLVSILFPRNIQLFEFFKLAIAHTEKYMKGDGKEGFDFTPLALEYIERKSQFLKTFKDQSLIWTV